MVHAIMLIGIM